MQKAVAEAKSAGFLPVPNTVKFYGDDMNLDDEYFSDDSELTFLDDIEDDSSRDTAFSHLQSREERQKALRLQDLEHKNAALNLSQESSKAPQYPHVYISHESGHNLSYNGRAYSLPVGSEHLQYERYEEYSIPAAKRNEQNQVYLCLYYQ